MSRRLLAEGLVCLRRWLLRLASLLPTTIPVFFFRGWLRLLQRNFPCVLKRSIPTGSAASRHGPSFPDGACVSTLSAKDAARASCRISFRGSASESRAADCVVAESDYCALACRVRGSSFWRAGLARCDSHRSRRSAGKNPRRASARDRANERILRIQAGRLRRTAQRTGCGFCERTFSLSSLWTYLGARNFWGTRAARKMETRKTCSSR